jgi:membrane protease YdiL (CAAX protease family)
MYCAYCGSVLRRDESWCGLCLHPVGQAATAPATAVAVAERPVDDAPPEPFDASTARVMLAGGYERPEWLPPPPGLFPGPVSGPETVPRGAGRATALAIGVGALGQAVFWLVTRGSTVENAAAIRYAIATTLGVYAVVAVIVLRRVAADGFPLRWRGGSPSWFNALVGVAVGGGLATFLLTAALAAGADGGGDPRIDVLVSEGDLAHIGASVLIACVAAPVLEELLFRGLLLASLQRHGTKYAVWASAGAFAVWHLNPSALRYYALMGALLGFLYVRRGLSCSIAAHAAFNGMLTLATIVYVLSPGPTASADGLVLRAPKGWHSKPANGYVVLTGPSGSDIAAGRMPGSTGYVDVDMLWDRVDIGLFPGSQHLVPRPETARPVDLPAGRALRVRVKADGRDGDVVLLPVDGRLYLVIFASGGSAHARADFDRILQDMSVSPA